MSLNAVRMSLNTVRIRSSRRRTVLNAFPMGFVARRTVLNTLASDRAAAATSLNASTSEFDSGARCFARSARRLRGGQGVLQARPGRERRLRHESAEAPVPGVFAELIVMPLRLECLITSKKESI